MRPRIFFRNGIWWCVLCASYGVGLSAPMAYSNWAWREERLGRNRHARS